MIKLRLMSLIVIAVLAAGGAVAAEKKYDVGVSDSEIKIGNVMPYSGPASSYSVIGKVEAAYFKKVNDEGGINGRKVTFISYDDAYSPPKTVEQTRKLVEGDEVLLMFGMIGSATNSATQKYLNSKKVPQLFLGSGATKFGYHEEFPWTMGWLPSFQSEGRTFAKHLLEKHANGKIAVLWQNDEFGKDLLKGLREGLGDTASMIVADKSHELTDPTIDSQVVALKQSGADIFVSFASAKAAAQAIKKVAELGWKPTYLQVSVSSSVAAVLKPAGLENAKGLISTGYYKDPSDPTWKNDLAMKDWFAFMDKYYPDGDKTNAINVSGYILAEALVHVLRQCADDLTRANVMKNAASLRGYRSELMLPGIAANTSPSDFYPIEQLQLMQFDGETWRVMDSVIDASLTR